MNKGTDTIQKIICHSLQFNITFPPTSDAKRLRCFNFLYFHNCWNLNLAPTGACWYQEWNFFGVGATVAESKPWLATKIFTTALLSFLTKNYCFSQLRLRHFISTTKIHHWRIFIFIMSWMLHGFLSTHINFSQRKHIHTTHFFISPSTYWQAIVSVSILKENTTKVIWQCYTFFAQHLLGLYFTLQLLGLLFICGFVVFYYGQYLAEHHNGKFRLIIIIIIIIMMFYCGLMVHITDTRTQKVVSYTSAHITETV